MTQEQSQNTEKKQQVTRWEGVKGEEKWVSGNKGYKLPVEKQVSHDYKMHNVGNIVNNFVTSLVTDGN